VQRAFRTGRLRVLSRAGVPSAVAKMTLTTFMSAFLMDHGSAMKTRKSNGFMRA
jgi:hypothetical protein